MTQEEIKKTWQEGARRLFRPTMEEYEHIYLTQKETSLDSLARRYKKFSMIGLAMVFCSFAWMSSGIPFESHNLRIIVAIVMAVYFTTCSIIDRWLYKGVSSIDCYTMSVQEVIDKAMYYRKKHLQSMILLIPFAIIVVGLMAYSLKADRYILYGMAAGGIVGLIIGTFQFMEFMGEYRKIKE